MGPSSFRDHAVFAFWVTASALTYLLSVGLPLALPVLIAYFIFLV